MTKYEITFIISGVYGCYVDAESPKEAVNKAMKEMEHPSLCWQCAGAVSMDDLPHKARVAPAKGGETVEIEV